jgi:tetratricopeptide (TPR) repeat protein
LYAGNAAEALPLLERAVVLARGVVEPTPIILAYFWLGCVNEAIADFAEARRALGEALAVAMKEQFKPPLAHTLYRLGHVAHGQGQHAEARLHYVRGLEVLVETGDYWGMSQVLDALGCLGIDRDAGLAVMLLGAADALRQRMGAQILPTDRENHERAVRAAREAQGDEAFSDAWTRGRALPIAEALEIARTFSRGGDDASPPDTEVSAG